MSLAPLRAVGGRTARHGAFALPFRLFFVVALLLSTFGGAFGALTPGASAATITFNVNSTADTITPGACAAALANACTLREAIIEANALAVGNTIAINLDANATYTLSNYGNNEDLAATGDLDVKADLTINGKGSGTGPGAIIIGNDPTLELGIQQEDRVFQVFGGYTVIFNDLTIEDGYAYQSNGGGILHDGGEATGGTLTLNGVTVTDSDTGNVNLQDNPGAGIYNGVGRTLTLNNSTVSDNGKNTTTNPGNGGGIYNAGTATITGGTITGNLGNSGGGIYNEGGITLTGAIISNNTANANNNSSSITASSGGGLFSTGTTTITSSTITGNFAALGGGVLNLGDLTVAGSTISSNSSLSFGGNSSQSIFASGGGGLMNGGTATISDSQVIGNSAILAGGIANTPFLQPANTNAKPQAAPGTLTITNSVVNANNALITGGGIINVGALIFTGGALTNNSATGFILFGLGGQGGGLLNLSTATLTNTAITGNTASTIGLPQSSPLPIPFPGANLGNGAGIANAGGLTIDGTTLANNTVTGPGTGGAIFNGPALLYQLMQPSILRPASARAASVDTVATLTNSTLTGNVATAGGAVVLNDDNSTVNLINTTIANNQSGVQNRTGETNPNGVINVQNTILASNTDYNCSGTIVNGGYNIDSAATCAFGTTGGSLSNTDPQLGPLALNAPGTTQTFALAATSPALDKIPASGANCPATDQRGVARPQGTACDIGAYELVVAPVTTFTVAVSTTGNGSVNPGAGTYTYQSGSTQAFTATPAAGQIFLGWTVDGTFVGFGNPLNLPVTKNRTVVAAFAPIPTFCDVTTATDNYTAIAQLAARGVIFGSDNPNGSGKCFNGGEYLQRIQVAGFVARLFGWDKEDHGNTFIDKGYVDNDLWRNAGTLAFYDVARGYRDGTYDPTGNVLHAQTVSFVTRAMIRKGYWEYQGDNAAYYTAVPTASGHRQDAVTFYTYAGNIPGTSAPTDAWGGPTGYDGQSTRNYFVNVLWQAYSSYFSTNHIP